MQQGNSELSSCQAQLFLVNEATPLFINPYQGSAVFREVVDGGLGGHRACRGYPQMLINRL
jgi:hypothetical protein